jgi:hypothetical protein
MTETVVEKPTPSVTLGEPSSRGYSTSPRIEDFSTSGGVYREAYDNVAARLKTTDDKRIVAELYREHWSNTAMPQDAAQGLIDITTVDGWFSVSEVDSKLMAAEIVAMRRTNPEQATKVEAEIARRLPDAGFQSRLNEDIRTITEDVGQANNRIRSLGSDATTPTGQTTDNAQVTAKVDQLLADATRPVYAYRQGLAGDNLNVTELAYQVEVLAADNPELVQAVRAELTGRLSPTDAATFNRIVAGDRNFGEGIGLAFSHPGDTAIGVGQNTANGFIFVGDMALRGGAFVGGLAADGTALVTEGHAWALGRGATALDGMLGTNMGETVRPAVETLNEISDNQSVFADGAYIIASEPIIPSFECSNAAQCVGQDIGLAIDIATGVKAAATLGAKGVAIWREIGEQADEAVPSVIGQLDEAAAPVLRQAGDVVPPVSRQTDDVIAPIVAREFSVFADSLPGGNQIILVDGQYWNVPAGKSVADLPLDDLVGDKLQALTTESAARWGDNPRDMFSTKEFAAILRNSDSPGLVSLFIQQAKGRWVEALVKGTIINENSNISQNLIWISKGLDVTDLSTGIKYDIMSGTSQNLLTHALREPNQIFRMIAF